MKNLFKYSMKILLIIILIFSFSTKSFSFSHDKILKELNKAADQLNKELNNKTNEDSKTSSDSNKKPDNSNTKESEANNEKLKKERAEKEKLKKEQDKLKNIKLAENEKLEKELNELKNVKLSELSDLEKNNKANIDLAIRINNLLFTLPKKDNKEIQDILLDYNNNLSKLKQNIQKAQSKTEIDEIIIDPEIIKNINAYVSNNKEKVTSLENEYKVFQEEENKRIALEEKKRKIEDEKIRVENEKKEAERIRLAKIEEEKYLKTYAGQIDGWENLKFGETRSSVEAKIKSKNCEINEHEIKQESINNTYASVSFVVMGSSSAFQTTCYNIMGKTGVILVGFDNINRLNLIRTAGMASITKNQQYNFSAVEKYSADRKKIREVLGQKYKAFTTIDQKIFWETIKNLKKTYDAKQKNSYMIGYAQGQVFYLEEREPFYGIEDVTIFYISANNKKPLQAYDKILKQSSKAATGGGL